MSSRNEQTKNKIKQKTKTFPIFDQSVLNENSTDFKEKKLILCDTEHNTKNNVNVSLFFISLIEFSFGPTFFEIPMETLYLVPRCFRYI